MSETIRSSTDRKVARLPRAPVAHWRIAALVLGLVTALAVVAWIKSSIWQGVGQLETSFATIRSESFLLGVQGREGLGQLNASLLRHLLSGDGDERERFRTTAQALRERFRRITPHLSSPKERKAAAQFEQAFQGYLASSAELLERTIRGVRKDSALQAQQEIDVRSQSVLALADQFVQVQQTAMRGFFSESESALGSLRRLLSLSVGLLFLLLVSVAALTYRALIAPLRSKLSESQELIERQEKLASLGVLAAGVAHEIRNPLTAIKFRLFSLKKSLPAGSRDNEDISVINNELNRLERIVKDFLHFARPSEPELAPVELGDLLQQVQNLLSEELGRRGIALEIEPGPPITVRADRQQLQQVLINLVQNGAESIGQKGRITLRVREGATRLGPRHQPVVMIDVSDTGKGITREAEKRLFDPFFSTKADGTGLGLPIAERIMEKHGGYLQYATQPERGTVFSVVLPQPLKS